MQLYKKLKKKKTHKNPSDAMEKGPGLYKTVLERINKNGEEVSQIYFASISARKIQIKATLLFHITSVKLLKKPVPYLPA